MSVGAFWMVALDWRRVVLVLGSYHIGLQAEIDRYKSFLDSVESMLSPPMAHLPNTSERFDVSCARSPRY